MKAAALSIVGLALFAWGYVFGSGVLEPVIVPHHHGLFEISKPTSVATPIVLPTATEISPVAHVVIVDAPAEPANQVISEPVQVIIPDVATEAAVIIVDVQPTTSDLSEWIIPLDPAAPSLASPYDAGSGPTANIVPEALPVEQYSSMSLDQAWDTAVAMGIDQRFPSCSYPLPVPFIDWQMAIELSELQTADRQYTEIKMLASDVAAIAVRGGAYFPSSGIVQIPEDTIPPMLLQLYTSGSVMVCRDGNNKPSGFGPGVQIFLDQLASSYMVVQ
jgi:hypothetical protein